MTWQFLLLAAFALFFVAAGVRQFFGQIKLNDQITEKNKQLIDLQEQKKSLEATAAKYESGDFLEAEARNKLNLKKKGETVVVIKNISSSFGAAINGKSEADAALPRWDNLALWRDYFLK